MLAYFFGEVNLASHIFLRKKKSDVSRPQLFYLRCVLAEFVSKFDVAQSNSLEKIENPTSFLVVTL